jgi:hypothetical protein
MPRTGVEIDRLRERLDEADFGGLLIGELGWDNPAAGQEVRHDEDGTIARLVADKRGVGIWVVDGLPGPGPRRRIDVLIARRTRERLVVFDGGATQLWMWPEQRASGAGFRLVSHEYHVGSRNEALLQRLVTARFRLEEEDGLTVVDVLARVRRSFNADKVTKKFYTEFKEHRDELLGQINGIELEEEVAWYGSVLLNRLMLLYFLQKKGFLDDDRDYLRSRLRMVRDHLGDDSFYGFFKDFLLPLFHDGLGSHLQDYADEDVARIIGDVPYVNGGIFLPHVLEETYEIDVPDEAFEAIFLFFDRYRWHLDDKPSDDVNEINPDVLGYVFEQLVNSKEMGAYYTKEDVTGYMTSVTLLPAFLDRIAPVAGGPWGLLAEDPDRYIHDSVRHGVDDSLPLEIAESADEPFERPAWGEKAASVFGHPGETWWEVVDRRRRCERLRGRLAAGEVVDVSEAITENLDLRTLVDDHLCSLPDMATVEAVYEELIALTVLDPTCGSGAFLFAALEDLADLYLALVERATELEGQGGETPAFLEEARRHPNLRYFVLRTAQLNNLYGVDLMAEAGEIARLRLFLKLAAQVNGREDLEPFPDLDLNVKTGNLLVGVATPQDAEDRLSADLLSMDELARIRENAGEMSVMFRRFVDEQAASGDPVEIAALKVDLDERLRDLRGRLDRFLYERVRSTESFDDWEACHLPFHWFVEFPHVFDRGGFDVVIGNPPYVKRSLIDYEFGGFATDDATDIFAPCMERATGLLRGDGRFSMIVPIAFQFSDRNRDARTAVTERLPERWVSTYSRNPAALFPPGLGVRPVIVVGTDGERVLRTTALRRWVDEARPHLFETTCYEQIEDMDSGAPWARPGSGMVAFLDGRLEAGRSVGEAVRGFGPTLGFKQTALYYVSVFVDEPPAWMPDGERTPQTMIGWLHFVDEASRDLAYVLLAGRLATWWWGATGDDFHVTARLLKSFPIGLREMVSVEGDLLDLAKELRVEQARHPLVTKYAGKEMGNYDMSRCRHLTDQADRLVLKALGQEDLWSQVLLADSRLAKATGERPGTRREWPFPL